jgi:hypothetical protein
MPEYRLYCLNDDGRFAKLHEINAASDADALDQARELKVDAACELWNRNRLVAKLPPHHEAARRN